MARSTSPAAIASTRCSVRSARLRVSSTGREILEDPYEASKSRFRSPKSNFGTPKSAADRSDAGPGIGHPFVAMVNMELEPALWPAHADHAPRAGSARRFDEHDDTPVEAGEPRASSSAALRSGDPAAPLDQSPGANPRRMVFSHTARGSTNWERYSAPPAFEPTPDMAKPPNGWRPTRAPVHPRFR